MSFRLLQLGFGNRGGMWADIITHRSDVILVGLVEINPTAAARFAATHPTIPCFASLADALHHITCDAVLLVTPPDGHLAQARAIFAAGLPLLAEKPLAESLAEAVEIVALAEAAQLPLSVGLNFRYLSVTQALRDLITAETFGPPGFGQFIYQRNRDGMIPRLNKYPLTMQHPMMLEQSIHHLDLIRFCYSREVTQVMCRTWNPPWSMYAHDANVHCLLTMEDGLEVNYLGTWTGGWDELQFQWRTDCPNGVIIQRQLFDDLVTAHTQDTELTQVELTPCRAFYDDTAALLTDFIAAVQSHCPVPCSGRDHLASMALCWAAIESSQTGQAVEVGAFSARHGAG